MSDEEEVYVCHLCVKQVGRDHLETDHPDLLQLSPQELKKRFPNGGVLVTRVA